MKLLAFSDLHRDMAAAAELVERSAESDLVIGAGDFGSVHEGVGETIAALAAITTPTLLVPGNNETEEELREAVTTAGWDGARIPPRQRHVDRRPRFLRTWRRRPDDALGLELRPDRGRGRRAAGGLPGRRGPDRPLAPARAL